MGAPNTVAVAAANPCINITTEVMLISQMLITITQLWFIPTTSPMLHSLFYCYAKGLRVIFFICRYCFYLDFRTKNQTLGTKPLFFLSRKNKTAYTELCESFVVIVVVVVFTLTIAYLFCLLLMKSFLGTKRCNFFPRPWGQFLMARKVQYIIAFEEFWDG